MESNTTVQQPWLAHYPPGVAATIKVNEPSTLIDLVEGLMKQYASRKAFTLMGKSLSYQEIDEMSTAFGAYLQHRGLEPGDRLAIMSPNLLQYPIALFGAFKAGLIVVNTNPLYTPREMQHQFTDAGVKGILISETCAANLQKILPNTEIKVVVTTSIGELLGLKGKLVNFAVRNIKKLVPTYNLPNAEVFKSAIEQGAACAAQAAPGRSRRSYRAAIYGWHYGRE